MVVKTKRYKKMYFVKNRWIVAAPKGANRATIGQTEGQKYKIVNFAANFPCVTLKINNWSDKMIVKTKDETMYFASHRYAVGALKTAKRPTQGA